jgi:hypothetical protein
MKRCSQHWSGAVVVSLVVCSAATVSLGQPSTTPCRDVTLLTRGGQTDTYTVTEPSEPSRQSVARGRANLRVGTIRLQWRPLLIVGSYERAAGRCLSFLWHPASSHLSVSQSSTRLGVVTADLEAATWTADEMTLYVLAGYERELEAIIHVLAEATRDGSRRIMVRPLADHQDPNPGGGGGGCNGHYMTEIPVYCHGFSAKLLAVYDPQAGYEDGYRTGGDACDGWCRDDDYCRNPY